MSSRPNTNLPNDFLCPQVLLCAGETAAELLSAVKSERNEEPVKSSEYRCYRFWTFSDFLLGWTGIGTGCVEPWLYELLRPAPEQVIRRMVLVGTAGRLQHKTSEPLKLGSYWISKAYLGPSGVQSFAARQPLVPRFTSSEVMPHASIISTDLFYSFTQPSDIEDPKFQKQVAAYWADCGLIDMEVAQFYFFCDRFSKQFRLNDFSYLAVKGPSNDVGDAEQQLRQTDSVLRACVRAGLRLLK